MSSSIHSKSSITPEWIESKEAWKNEYTPIPLDSVTIRQYKLKKDQDNSETFFQNLDNRLKPLLPEGHIWSTERKVEILRHKSKNESNFEIRLFGPDDKNRISYLVVDIKEKEHTPLFGMAMTRKEGFPKDLRNKYPQDSSFFEKKGLPTFWRGHIIDYNDTTVSFKENSLEEQESLLSTSFAPNYKPEPPGAWANIIRKEIVQDIRPIEGAYSELMLYGYNPEKTEKGKKIPEAVLLSTLTAYQEYLTSYYVPKDHPCHQWEGRVKVRAQELALSAFLPPLFANFNFPFHHLEGKDPVTANFLEAYQFLRNAEMEYLESTCKMQYLLVAKKQNASDQTLEFWLKRSCHMAYNVTIAFQGKKAPFPQSLMNKVQTIWNQEDPLFQYVEKLGKIALVILQKVAPVELSIDFEQKEEATSLGTLSQNESKNEDVDSTSIQPQINPLKKSEAIEIYCVGPRNLGYENMVKKIKEHLSNRSYLKIKNITSEVAAKTFPEISEEAKKKDPTYQPIVSVEASSKRWEKKVEALTIQYFGTGIFIKIK